MIVDGCCRTIGTKLLLSKILTMSRLLDRSPPFIAGLFRAAELIPDDIPALQIFFEANPAYFTAVTGQPPRVNEAYEEFHEPLPAGMSFTRRWLIGLIDESGDLVGMANVTSDLLAESVWHIGLFVVATSLHGSGAAQAFHAQLESWMRSKGAKWIRLGVVEGNARAECFWEGMGYVEMRRRTGVEMGERMNTLRVMMKPLASGNREEYLALVARDRPE